MHIFFLNFATLAEPLQQLTRSDSECVWGEIQQDAFDRFQVALTSDCAVLAHYDQSGDTELKVDASPVGLGAILLPRSSGTVRPVAYACHVNVVPHSTINTNVGTEN